MYIPATTLAIIFNQRRRGHVIQALIARNTPYTLEWPRIGCFWEVICDFTEELWSHYFQMSRATFFELSNAKEPLVVIFKGAKRKYLSFCRTTQRSN